jgi:protein-S-isoprenylcysteine O-methyltransferase Ste14
MSPTITIQLVTYGTSLLWLLIAAVWLGSAPFTKKTVYQQSLSTRIEHIAVIAIGLYLLFGSPIYPSWINKPILEITLPVALAGFAIVIFGVAFTIWARLTLGNNWSGTATIKQDHTLIRRGPYSIVRHPIYTGLLIAMLGTALQRGFIHNFLSLPILAVGFWLKVMIEEQIMIQRFGDEYLRYRREVRALAPFIF